MSSTVFLITGLRRWKKRASNTLEKERRGSEAVEVENNQQWKQQKVPINTHVVLIIRYYQTTLDS